MLKTNVRLPMFLMTPHFSIVLPGHQKPLFSKLKRAFPGPLIFIIFAGSSSSSSGGFCVGVGVGTIVGVAVGITVAPVLGPGITVDVGAGVRVEVKVGVGTIVGVAVGITVALAFGTGITVDVGAGVRVEVKVGVGTIVGVAVGITVDVGVGVEVNVGVGVISAEVFKTAYITPPIIPPIKKTATTAKITFLVSNLSRIFFTSFLFWLYFVVKMRTIHFIAQEGKNVNPKLKGQKTCVFCPLPYAKFDYWASATNRYVVDPSKIQ